MKNRFVFSFSHMLYPDVPSGAQARPRSATNFRLGAARWCGVSSLSARRGFHRHRVEFAPAQPDLHRPLHQPSSLDFPHAASSHCSTRPRRGTFLPPHMQASVPSSRFALCPLVWSHTPPSCSPAVEYIFMLCYYLVSSCVHTHVNTHVK
jgi:hypothetical protein